MEYLKDNEEKRNIYIDNLPREEALHQFMERLSLSKGTEKVLVRAALGRITAEAVYATMSSPHYHSAAMDGIVLKASTTEGANERQPKMLKEHIDFEYINTGYPIEEKYDAVIMIEDVIPVEKGVIKLIESAYPWQHVRLVGEDVAVGEMLLPSKHCIRALDIGALLSGGVESLTVIQPMKVGIIPTGNEITRDLKHLAKGQIIDSNSGMFSGLVEEAGGIPTVYPPVSDEPKRLEEVIMQGVVENDLVIVNAGSSAGSKDYTADTIRTLGEVVIHGIAMKPGKPTILGVINEKPIIGIPGFPVSAYFAFMTFVAPIIRQMSGEGYSENKCQVYLSKRIVSSLKHEEYVRMTLGCIHDKWIGTPLQRGAGNTTSLVKADGVLTIPRNIEGYEKGECVDVTLMKSLLNIRSRTVFIGSHDLMLDVIGDIIPVSSAHVGSLGGLLAIQKGECHLAPIHLLDEDTGRYNENWISKFFPQGKVSVIEGIKRLQGIMVPKGNPKNIKGFEDLTREDICFVNRQKGSGTRQLIDFELKKRQIESDSIDGYNLEMNTHMAIAVAVDSGMADVGIGSYSAAKSLDLTFIPIGYECYDFLVRDENLEDGQVVQFIETLKSKHFQKRLEVLGGYAIENIGHIRKVGNCHD
ncbi:MAG: molybdopterin biosynthesis protein [Cellulosilyticaceae bacterium]